MSDTVNSLLTNVRSDRNHAVDREEPPCIGTRALMNRGTTNFLQPTAGTDRIERPHVPRSQAKDASSIRSSWLERAVLKQLSAIDDGELRVQLPSGETWTGGAPASDGLSASVVIHDTAFFRECLLGGSLGAAESYLQGGWSCDDLTALLRIACRNLDRLAGLDGGLARVAGWFARLWHWTSRNTEAGSRRNIAAHYDLGNDFFRLFLDPTLMYSSGLFTSEEKSLESASLAKLERVCRQLDLQPGDEILEIGTGWGGFAEYAAKNYGCRITTTTISRQQFEFARQRLSAVGLDRQVTLLLEDYRRLSGRYDKIASIEMIEAVGEKFLGTYFGCCNRLLKRGGRLAVQAIVMPDQRYEAYCRSVDFIQKYVFPGGHVPSIGAMQRAVAAETSLQLVDVLQFPGSYARTLRLWREAFLLRLDDVRRLGFDERFIRLWEHYLCYCEAAFLERTVGVGQFVWEKCGG
jgi:cyclopropane-fatty-acyl-phospholipid synthase